MYVCMSSRIYENRTIGLLEPTHLKLTKVMHLSMQIPWGGWGECGQGEGI